MNDTPLTTAAREVQELSNELAAVLAHATAEEKRLREEIRKRTAILTATSAGLDPDKIALARTVLVVRGTYDKAGQDRASVIADAVKQLSTGEPIRPHYGDLWRVTFGTKNYDGWTGQRSDHEYGFGPRHGYTVFSVGITKELRDRKQAELTPEQVEAAVYLLVNIQRVEAAEAEAKAKADAA